MTSLCARGAFARSLFVALGLALSLSSCVFAVNARPKDGAEDTAKVESKSGGESGKPDAADANAKADRAKARKAEKRSHELELARLELENEEFDQEHARAEAQRKLEEARKALSEAQLALEHFVGRVQPRELAEATLSLDRSKQRREEAQLELREMEATYAKDQFAKDTKELVLSRHRKQLEFASRDLELSQQRFDDERGVQLPKSQREHEKKVRDAEAAVRDAEVGLRRTNAKAEMALRRGRFKVKELEQSEEDEDGGKKGGA